MYNTHPKYLYFLFSCIAQSSSTAGIRMKCKKLLRKFPPNVMTTYTEKNEGIQEIPDLASHLTNNLSAEMGPRFKAG